MRLHAEAIERSLPVNAAVEILRLESEDHIRIGNSGLSRQHAGISVQRVIRREIHAHALILHAGLHQFGQFDQMLDGLGRPGDTAGEDHRILGIDQHLRGCGHSRVIALRRRADYQL